MGEQIVEPFSEGATITATGGLQLPPACPAGSTNLNTDIRVTGIYVISWHSSDVQPKPIPVPWASCQKLQSSWLPCPDALTEGQEEASWHNLGKSEHPCKEHSWSLGTQPAPTVTSTHRELFSVFTQTPVQRFQKGGTQRVRRY